MFTLGAYFEFILTTVRFSKIRERQNIKIIESIYKIMLLNAQPGLLM